jgi:hypothetical protein
MATETDPSILCLCPANRLGCHRLRHSEHLREPCSKPISNIAPRFADSPGYRHANTGTSYGGANPFSQPDANGHSGPKPVADV